MVVAGNYRFYAAGVEVSDVRSTCVSVVANVTAVSEDRLECSVSLLEEFQLRQLQVQSQPLQTFLASFVISVQQEQEADVRADLEAIEADNATSFALLVEEALSSVVANSSLLEQSFSFREYDVTVIESAMEMFLLEMARQEAKALSVLLESNDTYIALDLGDGSIAVAAGLAGNEPQRVQVSEAVTVTVPFELFDQFGEEELILVAVLLADSVASLTQAAADDPAQQTGVEASITITLYTTEGASLIVTNSAVPIRFSFAVDQPEELSCAVWNETLAQWDADNVIQDGFGNRTLDCATVHLSLFGAITKGFLDAFRCTQAKLLTSAGFNELWKLSWAVSPSTLPVWTLVTILAVLVIVAHRVDVRRAARSDWSDECFLVPERDAAPGESNPEGKTEVQSGRGAYCLLCLPSLAGAHEVFCLAATEILNEVLGTLWDHCDTLWQLGVGVVDMIRGECSDESLEVSGGRVAMLLAIAARAATQRTAHLNTCVHMGIHYEDEYAEHLEELQTQVQRCASFSEPSQSENNTDSPSGSNQRSPRNNDMPMPVIDDRGLSRGASTVSSHAVNSQARLKNIHSKYSERLEKEHEHLHRVGHIVRNTLRQFLYHSPIGSVFAYSITVPCGIRALLLACETMGSFFVATLFMQASNKSRSINSPSECASTDNDAASATGRFIALGLASSVLAVFPVLAMSKLHVRRVVRIDYVGSKAWELQLRTWSFLDAILWCVGISYAVFCTMYVMLFFANTIQQDHSAWLLSAITAAVTDFVVAPVASIAIPPLIVVILIILLSTIVWKPRKDVMKLVRGHSQQAEDTKETSSDEANLEVLLHDADSTYSVPLEHQDDDGVIIMPSQQMGSIQTLLVLPEPVTKGDDASRGMSVSPVLEIDAVHVSV
eukprot:4979114-Amphidinium_carterae.1